MAHNTIKIKKYSDVIEEMTAAGVIYPGMLVLLGSGDTIVAHSDDAPANCVPMFALEDALQGKDIDDAYASGDKVQVWIPGRGDFVYAILENGENIAIGDFLESNGAGYLQKYTSGKAIAQAVEALDLSGSSGEESSAAPFGYNKRIVVRII